MNLEGRISKIETVLNIGVKQFVSFTQWEDEPPHHFKDGKEIIYTPEAFPDNKFDVMIFRFE